MVINLLVFAQFILENDAKNVLKNKKYSQAHRLVHNERIVHHKSDKEINLLLKNLNLELSDFKISKLKKIAKKHFSKDNKLMNIYFYENKKYVLILSPEDIKPFIRPEFLEKLPFPPPPHDVFLFAPRIKKNILFIDNSNDDELKYLLFIVLLFIDFLLIWFYVFLRNKIKPLHLLKKSIIEFSEGNLNISTKIKGNDEIAQVSNEFNKAIIKIKELTESRNLFLRNIMHELKTPITKGKLISDTLLESRRKEILQKAFYRLEYLLEEFAKIEELTSGKIKLQIVEYRIADVIDQALDLLLIEKDKVELQNLDLLINIDFKLFSIALKNLIDNSLKYNKGDKPIIYVENKSIYVKNEANKLKKPFDEYLRPFSREYESIDKGLGLGLYITNSIVNIHKLKLEYKYEDGFNIFIIHF